MLSICMTLRVSAPGRAGGSSMTGSVGSTSAGSTEGSAGVKVFDGWLVEARESVLVSHRCVASALGRVEPAPELLVRLRDDAGEICGAAHMAREAATSERPPSDIVLPDGTHNYFKHTSVETVDANTKTF